MGKDNKQGKSRDGFKKQGRGGDRGGGRGGRGRGGGRSGGRGGGRGRGRGRGRGGSGGGRGFDRGGHGGGFGRRRKLEITFDPDARREYLTGMSARKKERRVFGLAMQKIKDRRDKLDRKKEDRKSRLEKVEEAETLKRLAKGQGEDDDDESDSGSGSESGDDASVSSSESKPEKSKKKRSKPAHDEVEETQKTYSDANTTSQFGGSVIVTTTYGIPSDDESDDPDIQGIVSNKPHIDEAQWYAGNVKKYMSQVRSNLPDKKRKREQMGGGGGHRKGKHGASDMKGMGSGTDMKMAKKALKMGRAAEKGGGMDRGGKKGKRGKKGRR